MQGFMKKTRIQFSETKKAAQVDPEQLFKKQ